MKLFKPLYMSTCLVSIAACSSGPARSADQVRLLSTPAEAAQCKRVKEITETERTGRDLVGKAMQEALEDAAAAGADAFYVLSNSVDQWPEQATVKGDALVCDKAP
ncbi:MAG TPA: hypothetical protein VKT74_09310, partial [Gammaproteobacteria bacterium]|nr:hypothetical protein [Gammaproteobacteria bacterium]